MEIRPKYSKPICSPLVDEQIQLNRIVVTNFLIQFIAIIYKNTPKIKNTHG